MTHEHTAHVKVHQYTQHRDLQQSRACAYVVVCEICIVVCWGILSHILVLR